MLYERVFSSKEEVGEIFAQTDSVYIYIALVDKFSHKGNAIANLAVELRVFFLYF